MRYQAAEQTVTLKQIKHSYIDPCMLATHAAIYIYIYVLRSVV